MSRPLQACLPAPQFCKYLLVMQAGQSDGLYRGVQRCALRSISACSRCSVMRQALLSAGANEALQVRSSLLKWFLLQGTTSMAEQDWMACAGTAGACRSFSGPAGIDSRHPSAASVRLSMGSSGHHPGHMMRCFVFKLLFPLSRLNLRASLASEG